MSAKILKDAWGPLILAGVATVLIGYSAANSATKKSPPRDTGTGTHAEEYRPNTAPSASSPSATPGNRTSTGRELTGPGAQPGEYRVKSDTPTVGKYDTLPNVRIRRDTLGRDTLPTSGSTRRDSLRGPSGGPTRPGGTAPRPASPSTPDKMPGSGGSSLPGAPPR